MRVAVSLELAVFVAVAVVAAAAGPAHAGWFADGDGVAAAHVLSPVTGHGPAAILIGGLAALIPVGELAFRIALVSGVALAVAAAGVVALTRALTPTAAGAGALAASLVATAPAAGLALPTGEAAIEAALVVWIVVAVVRGRRAVRDARPLSIGEALAAASGTGALVAIDPLAAIVMAAIVAVTLGRALRARSTMVILALATAAVLIVPLALRGVAPALADVGSGGWRAVLAPGHDGSGLGVTLARLGDGAGAVLVLAGLLGLGLGATTGLPGAATAIVAALALAATAATRPDGAPLAALALIAAGLGPLTAAVARLASPPLRTTIATIAALPIAVVAALAPRHLIGPERTDAVARVAADVLATAPPGPGVFVVVEPAVHGALRVEQVVGGLRPDLALARRDRMTVRALAAIDHARPELHTPRIDDAVSGNEAERLAVGNLRGGLTVGSDRPSFGLLEPRLAHPVGRGFALALADDPAIDPPPPPATYPGPTGARIAGYLAVERAVHELHRGRLEAAARAAGLTGRFGAADLAMLDGAALDARRPSLLGFLPARDPSTLPPRWLPDLIGDDLAWIAGLAPPALDDGAPVDRRLHARWRAVLAGDLAADDPSIRALGEPAVRATARMLTFLRSAPPSTSPPPAPPPSQ